ncbi:MAG: 4-(cytidine 5'-diphospho)-2-C-methyl-D-erythritol kinase [Promicromonosporaceae bacterium]|nr:4-(cytidine 5'-diphospho)-2-C-methyl-D-erythritol kinase [Promicromonosporaceae bacterium]
MNRTGLSLVAAAAVRVRAPGKVNLSLRVGPLQPDGYHPLVSVFQAVNLVEDVTATAAPPGQGITISVEGPGALATPQDHTNLAWQAAHLLAARVGTRADVRLHLRKGVPVAGGMAGGSADAAAALLACDALWGLGLPRTELLELAAELGSDVPFCLLGGTAVGTGRGHLLSPVMAKGEYHWAFGASDHGLSTPAVFREFDRLHPGGRPQPTIDTESDLLAALRAGDAAALGASLHNDLQPAALALRPELADVIAAALEDGGALGAIVSGSGPTIAALASSAAHARDLAHRWTEEGLVAKGWTTPSPCGGARLMG